MKTIVNCFEEIIRDKCENQTSVFYVKTEKMNLQIFTIKKILNYYSPVFCFEKNLS